MQLACGEAGKKWNSLEILSRECPAFVRSRTFLVFVADFLFCCVLWEILLVLCGSPGLSLCMKLVIGKESEGLVDLTCFEFYPHFWSDDTCWYIRNKWKNMWLHEIDLLVSFFFILFYFSCPMLFLKCKKLVQVEIWVAKIKDWEQVWTLFTKTLNLAITADL